jgi:formate hydrogenlyase subunit 3/multisubunit Na+/H+ antiporter MnhD subunit
VSPYAMTERKKQNDFLRELICSHDCARSQDLQSRIAQAERDEKCTCRALLLALLMAAFSLVGLCYSAVFVPKFLPDFFQTRTSTAIWFFTAFLFTSGICVVSFALFWWWYRSASNALYHEARKFITSQQLNHPSPTRTNGAVVSAPVTQAPLLDKTLLKPLQGSS